MNITFAYSFPEDCPFHLEGPVVSLYFNTHRMSSQFKIDQKTFKNHLKTVKQKLKDTADKKTIEKIMEPLEEILSDTSFWIYNQDACTIFVNKDECVVFRLLEPIKDRVIVSDSIYIKPLVRLNQHMDHYFVLGLTKDQFEVFEVKDNLIEPFKFVGDVSKTLKKVLGSDKTESFVTHGNYGHVSNRGVFHGHGGQKEESDLDTEKFFRYIDKAISSHITSLQPLPIIVCSISKNQQMYRRYAKDVNLIKEGIELSYDSLSIDELKTKSDEIIEKMNVKYFSKLQQQGQSAHSSNRYSDQINDIITSIDNKSIEKLFIEEDQMLKGIVNWDNKQYIFQDIENDVYDDLAEVCMKQKIEIYILPEQFMPTNAPIFAIINQ